MKKDDSGKFTKTWSESDEKFIIDNYDKFSSEYIALILGKTYGAVSTKIKRLGLKKNFHVIPWTEEEKIVVYENKDKTLQELVFILKTKTENNIKTFIKNELKYYKEDENNGKTINTKRNKPCKILWTKEENDFIINNYKIKTYEEIGVILGRTKNQIINQAKNLCIIKSNIKHWREYEDNYLIDNYGCVSYKEIMDKLGVTRGQLFKRVYDLNIENRKKWKENDVEFLCNNYKTMKIDDLAKELSRSKSSIKSKLCEMNLMSVWWEDYEDRYIIDNHKTSTIREMSEHLERSYNGVQHRMGRLGLNVSIIKYNGYSFDSNQELDVYKFIESNFTNKITKNNKTFYCEKHNEKYIPDFTINIKNKKTVIIEYFGMCIDNPFHDRFIKYSEKAERKCEYFNSLNNCLFIALYPSDLKDDFKGVREKLTSFSMCNNINLKGGEIDE